MPGDADDGADAQPWPGVLGVTPGEAWGEVLSAQGEPVEPVQPTPELARHIEHRIVPLACDTRVPLRWRRWAIRRYAVNGCPHGREPLAQCLAAQRADDDPLREEIVRCLEMITGQCPTDDAQAWQRGPQSGRAAEV